MKKEKVNSHQFEQYRRIVKFLSSPAVVLLELAIYYYAWMNYYNKNMTIAFWRRGNWLVTGEYLVLSLILHRLYGGLGVGMFKYWNLVYSHMISILGVSLLSYIQAVLFDKRMHNLTAVIVMTVVGLVIAMIWAFVFKKLYVFLFPGRRPLLVYGKNLMFHLMNRIDTREDKYEIAMKISIDGGIKKIISLAEEYDDVIIGDISAGFQSQLVKLYYTDNIRNYTVPKVSDILLRSSVELSIFGSPLYLSRNLDGLALDQAFVKRAMDIAIASLMLVVSSPFFVVIAALIKDTDHGPIFYTQKQLTEGGKIFFIYKFRTTIVNAESKSGPVRAGERDARILSVGRFLRAIRLDELLQLLNIIKGDMSLVGPRPERSELARVITKNIPEFTYRLKVKAGLTGYAQIYGRYYTISYDKLKPDLTYIRRYSIWLDLQLALMTMKVLSMRKSTDGFEDGKWEDPALKG